MNWILLKNSLIVGGLATLLAVVLGVAAGLFASCLPGRWRGRTLGLAALALVLPPFVVTNCWLDVLTWAGGWNVWLRIESLALAGTAWVMALMLWPIPCFAVWSAWRRLEPALLESDPAVSGRHLLQALLLPLARVPLAQAAALTLVLALNNFAVPAIFQVKVFPAEIWVRFNATLDPWGALALGWPLALAPVLLLAWFRRQGVPWPHLRGSLPSNLLRGQLGTSWFVVAGIITAGLGLLSIGLPLFQLARVPRTWLELPGALAAGASALWSSLWFSAAAASVIVMISLLLLARRAAAPGWPARFAAAPLSGAAAWFLWILFLLPGILLGIGLTQIFNRGWLVMIYRGVAIVILALGLRYAALAWYSLRQSFATADPNLADAARIEGATPWQLLRHVYWPQVASRVTATWYVIFLLCLWDVESLILIIPPGRETVALRIFNLLHYGHNAQVNALCVLLLGLALLPLLCWRLGRAWTNRTARLALASVTTACLLTGCSGGSEALSARLESRLFSRAEIIGTRGTGLGQLNKPRSVAVDQQDRVYAVDMTGRVQQFDPNGKFLLSWQLPQTELGRPKGMARDPQGNIVVVEPHYSRVNHFSTAGQLLWQWGTHGTNRGEFGCPRAIAINSNSEAYVSEYGPSERVQRFRLTEHSAAFVSDIGSPGNGPGQFNRPEGLCLDRQGRLYVADSCNHRIQVFDPEGRFLRAYGKAGSAPGELSYPYDICVDSAGRQYVCEFGNSRIQVFDPEDKPLEIIGGPGAAPGQFNNPWGVALDSAGNLYVADARNHRVQKLVRK